jgi:hypothetical protein
MITAPRVRKFTDGLRDYKAPEFPFLVDVKDYLAVLKFAGDDSFAMRGPGFDGCCAIGGFLADDLSWPDIVRDWQAVLGASPAIKYFRARECFELSGQFEGFGRTEADRKYNALVDVIVSHGEELVVLDSILTWDIYEHALSKEFKAFCKSPHLLCALGICMGRLKLVRDLGDFRHTTFLFDTQDGIERPILQSFEMAKQFFSPEESVVFGPVSFTDDKIAPPLQCADLIASLSRQEYMKLHGKIPAAYTRIEASVDSRRILWHEEELRDLMQRVETSTITSRVDGI